MMIPSILTSDVTTYINGMVTHLQAHFCQISLGTQIQVEAIDGYTYESGQSWTAESDSGSLSGPIKDITAASNSNADLHVFLCKDPQFYGVIGLAWLEQCAKLAGLATMLESMKKGKMSWQPQRL